jgi:tetratricopeptide (TPR) repeat protein
MKSPRAFAAMLLTTAMILAVPSKAQQKPFSQDQVQGMVRDGLGDETGAKLIEQRGIDFAPTQDFLQSLKTAGASEAFLAAVRSAKTAQPRGPVPKKPLNQIQVFALLAGQVPSRRVAMLVQERGIDFQTDDEYLAEVRLAGGDDELTNALKTAKVTKPEHIDPVLQARQTQLRQHVARAAEYNQRKQYADAVAEYQAAIRLAPEDADLHVDLGGELGNKGDWDGEIAQEREALRLNPKNEMAHVNLGWALRNRGDLDGGIAEQREALSLNPNNASAHFMLGLALGEKGDFDAEITEEREAVRADPNYAIAHYILGATLERKGDFGQGKEEYGAACELDVQYCGAYAQAIWRWSILLGATEPPSVQTGQEEFWQHIARGRKFLVEKQYASAETEYRAAVRLNPNDDLAHASLGAALAENGDLNGAIVEEREALRLNPNNDRAHYGLGLWLERTGNRQEALQEYRRANELKPQVFGYKSDYERLLKQVKQ